MRYYFAILLNNIKNKKFYFAVLIIISVMAFATGVIEKISGDISFNDYLINFLEGYNGFRSTLPVLAPLIATIPFATMHIDNRKSGTIKYLISRLGYKKYFNSLFITNFLLGFFAFFIAMSLFLLLSFLLYHKNIDLEYFDQLTRRTIYGFANKPPHLYIALIILHCSYCAAVFSSIGLAASYFIKNKFTAWLAPFVVSTISSLFALFVGLTIVEPMSIFDIARIAGMKIGFVLSYLTIILLLSYIIAFLKFKRDIKADEEI